MKQGCLEDLLRVRQLDTPDEVGEFDGVIETLSSEVLSKEDLVNLLSVFIDRTRHEEVMYGLLHLIEASDVNLVVAALVQAAPAMKMIASDWLDTFIFRLLNGDHSRNVLINNLRLGDGGGRLKLFLGLLRCKGMSQIKLRRGLHSFCLN
ncbi:Imm30 family immunity protein [Burkholderia sp. MSh2]|uniref:Imm30 family immunity protein n=1 Tax=Burkholderia sp. MSh2 TaxID=1506588 RepID=UPI0009DFB733|nr:Imm30 family immunity protein [Burkholderia sp. MSh2]